MIVASPQDYRELAKRRLPKFLFEYIDGGSYQESTLYRNRRDLDFLELRQRVLRDVSDISTRAEFLGQEFALPIGLGPVGIAGLNARRGETQAVRAAEKAGIPFCLSTVSACPLEEVAAAATRPFWFQLYMIRDREFMRDLLRRAHELGCNTLVFTVDMPMPGTRYRDYRSGLAGAPGFRGDLRRFCQALLKPAWAWDVGLLGRPHQLGNIAPVLGENSGLEDFFAWMANNFDPSVTWSDIEWLRSQWDRPILIKGILDREDARAAMGSGVDGIIVSNHGGRQLDGVPSSVRALADIAEEIDHQMLVLADGGIRSGLDVIRMMAMGADGVLLGRAWAYALAARGQAGIEHVLELMQAEMKIAMALTGSSQLSDIGKHNLVLPDD